MREAPRRIVLAVAVTLVVSSCGSPPIGRDLPWAFADAQPVFDQRVKERFPVGASEQQLVTELRKEGFNLDPKNVGRTEFKSAAAYELRGLPCTLYWTILWNAESGGITAIKGKYDSACL